MQLALGHVEHRQQRIEVVDAEQDFIELDVVALLHQASRDDATDGRNHRCVRQFQLGEIIDCALGLEVVANLVVLFRRQQLATEHLAGTTVIRFQFAQRGCRFREIQSRVLAVEPGQRLPRLDLVALLHHQLEQHAVGFGDYVRFGFRLQRRHAGIARRHRPARCRNGLDRYRIVLHGLVRRVGWFVATTGKQQEGNGRQSWQNQAATLNRRKMHGEKTLNELV